MSSHAATIAEIWGPAIDHWVSIWARQRSVQRFNINPDVLFSPQRVAVRCWMGVKFGVHNTRWLVASDPVATFEAIERDPRRGGPQRIAPFKMVALLC